MAALTAQLDALRQTLRENQAYLIEDPLNIRYLTGCTVDTGILLLSAGAACFMTDFRYIEAAGEHFAATDISVAEYKNPIDCIDSFVAENTIAQVELEADYQRVSALKKYQRVDANIQASGLLDRELNELRSVKQQYELDYINRAQQLTDAAFSHILDFIKLGVSEREIALELEFFMRQRGADGVSFELIALSGSNTSMPHGVPGDKLLCRGELVTMDFGCRVGGYCSDMTRTVALGGISDEMKRVYNTVLEAQAAALAAVRAGVLCREVDAAARDIINAAGYEGCFGHATGHGVGLYIHENPRVGERGDTVLSSGNVITIEPGIYLPGRFGVRIEDMVCVTDEGCLNFTKSDKSLIVL